MPIYIVGFRVVDEQGRGTSREVLFDAADEAALLVATGLFLPDFQAMTKSGVEKYTYRRSVAVNNVPGAGSNIDAGATFRMATPLVIDPTVKVPDPVEAIKDGQGGIDLGDLIVTTWFANYNPGSVRVNINNPSVAASITAGTLDK